MRVMSFKAGDTTYEAIHEIMEHFPVFTQSSLIRDAIKRMHEQLIELPKKGQILRTRAKPGARPTKRLGKGNYTRKKK